MFSQTLGTLCLFVSGTRVAAAVPSPINAQQQYTFAEIPPTTNLVWYPCFTSFFCAVMDVPLDYTNSSGSRAYVPWIKYSATAEPYKGVLMGNPGGPGDSGIEFLLQNAELGTQIYGSNFDQVAFEPRGIGYSFPLANCTPFTAASASAATLPRRFIDQLHGPEFRDQYFADFYRYSQTLGNKCQAVIGGPNGAGPHMNTGVVVRDIITFLDAYANSSYSQGVQDPSLFNYWGFSYGTVIGQTLANMFPDRVGRVILDGVVDANDYISGRNFNAIEYADEAFSTFFVYCNLAGPSQCAYYTGTTAQDVLARFERTLSRLDAKYAAARGWANATVIELTLEAVKIISYQASYSPIQSFASLATLLLFVEIAVQNLTMAEYQQLETMAGLNTPPTNLPEWGPAIQCSDNGNALYNSPLAALIPSIAIYEQQSYILGEEWARIKIACTGWPIVGKGRYAGPFGGPTRNPILFISNTRDPVTPLFNGQRAAGLYQGAQLLTIDGTGHTSVNTFNTCAFGKVYNFLQNGILPGSDNFCPLEAGPFGVIVPEGALKKRNDWVGIQKRMKSLMRPVEI